MALILIERGYRGIARVSLKKLTVTVYQSRVTFGEFKRARGALSSHRLSKYKLEYPKSAAKGNTLVAFCRGFEEILRTIEEWIHLSLFVSLSVRVDQGFESNKEGIFLDGIFF